MLLKSVSVLGVRSSVHIILGIGLFARFGCGLIQNVLVSGL